MKEQAAKLISIPGSDSLPMHAKCPKCGAVFEWVWQPTLVHAGSTKYMKCPSCGKKAWIQTGVSDKINWPKGGSQAEKVA